MLEPAVESVLGEDELADEEDKRPLVGLTIRLVLVSVAEEAELLLVSWVDE